MGVHARPFSELAPDHVAFSHVGLPALWVESWRAPHHQCAASYHNRDSPLPSPAPDDRRSVAQRFCGVNFCDSSVTGGVGRLGGGTKGCSERALLRALYWRLRSIRAGSVARPLWPCSGALCLGLDVQADASDVAFCSPVTRLLAAKSNSRAPRSTEQQSSDCAPANCRKAAAFCPGRNLELDDDFCPEDRAPVSVAHLSHAAPRKCDQFLRSLSASAALAEGFGALLSVQPPGPFSFESCLLARRFGPHFHSGLHLGPSPPISGHRLALVSHYAYSGDRHSPGGNSITRGSIYLPSTDRPCCSAHLDGRGSVGSMASPALGFGHSCSRHCVLPCILCAHSGFVLAKQRIALDPHPRVHHRQRGRRTKSRAGCLQSREIGRSARPLSKERANQSQTTLRPFVARGDFPGHRTGGRFFGSPQDSGRNQSGRRRCPLQPRQHFSSNGTRRASDRRIPYGLGNQHR